MSQPTNRPGFATRAIHAGQLTDPGAIATPIYALDLCSGGARRAQGVRVFTQPQPDTFRVGRLRRFLENGAAGFAFASGLAAMGTILNCSTAATCDRHGRSL